MLARRRTRQEAFELLAVHRPSPGIVGRQQSSFDELRKGLLERA